MRESYRPELSASRGTRTQGVVVRLFSSRVVVVLPCPEDRVMVTKNTQCVDLIRARSRDQNFHWARIQVDLCQVNNAKDNEDFHS